MNPIRKFLQRLATEQMREINAELRANKAHLEQQLRHAQNTARTNRQLLEREKSVSESMQAERDAARVQLTEVRKANENLVRVSNTAAVAHQARVSTLERQLADAEKSVGEEKLADVVEHEQIAAEMARQDTPAESTAPVPPKAAPGVAQYPHWRAGR